MVAAQKVFRSQAAVQRHSAGKTRVDALSVARADLDLYRLPSLKPSQTGCNAIALHPVRETF
jgi:hypothetical protein